MKTISYLLLSSLLLFSTVIIAMPPSISTRGEKVIVVDPNTHTWAAYDTTGRLVRSGLASSGSDFCKDLGRPCHTQIGQFRIRSLGGPGCKSPSFPLGKGGSPMPYCMYFNDVQAIHGSYHVVNGNISHGCVRLKVNDARWLRTQFATIGTLVVIKPYYNGGSFWQ